ncbi:MAG TPA: SMR family transporter [Stellaceae bacterium]|nr:SMR family transporter [Stellaceae bacterium]
MNGWLMLAGSITFNVAGNLLVKAFSVRPEAHGLLGYLSAPFVFGVAAFGLGVLLYGRALQQIPIVLAYPIQVGACVIVIALVAVSVFGERLGLQTLVGIFLVMSGIAVLSHVV